VEPSYCPKCGAKTVWAIPAGDNRERPICEACEFVHYVNPSTVVGAVCVFEDKFVLCKRAIEPRTGYWTIPAGFLELRETAVAGAIRETLEEANAKIQIRALLAVYSIPFISQTQILFLADLLDPNISAGEESLEVGLFRWEDIPWDELAFPTVQWSLEHARKTLADPSLPPDFNSREPEPF